MVKAFKMADLDKVMEIWLKSNLEAHHFIKSEYWQKNLEEVRMLIPQAEVYVYEEKGEVKGFIGLMEGYIAGLFVVAESRMKGVGSELMAKAKALYHELSLNVYCKNQEAVEFYKGQGFVITETHIEETTQEQEYLMKWNKAE